ncbi:hypothetical protein [Bacillus toyonensis]|uniref:hypothetical protein n=1 Tax=Bacillus toyonensis TaxID=155322 RepID=UPI003D1D4583
MEEEYRKREVEIKKKRVLEELKNNKFEFKELQQNITNPLKDILAFNQSVDKLNKTIQSTYKTNSEVMQQIAENALKQSTYKTNFEVMQQIAQNAENALKQSTYKTNSEVMQQIAQNAENALRQSTYKTNFEVMQQIAQNAENALKQSTYKTNFEVMQQIAQRALKQSIDNSQIFKEFNANIKEMMDSIDWEAIDARIAKKLKRIDNLLQELEKEFLCLDMEIFDALEGEKVTQDILEYINQNLETYVEVITRDPIYELHETLIKETYEAYKGGLYKLCVMPLFAAFEHVIATWSDGKINTNLVSVRQKPERYRVTSIKPEKYIDIEQEQYIKVFSLSVLRMIGKIFVGVPKDLCQELNRNSIAHGYHDYDSITKEDILKLFQLLKSTLVLRNFNVKDAER